MNPEPAVFKDDQLDEPTGEKTGPDDVHPPTGGYSESGGMKRPPEEPHPRYHKKNRQQETNSGKYRLLVIGA